MKLRDYQERCIQLIGAEVKQGRRAVVVCMATGLGKTATLGELCRRHLEKVPTGKILWAAHREELVAQAWRAFDAIGVEAGVIQATPFEQRAVNPFRRVQVASIQTLIARELVLDGITLFVHDEAHRGISDEWSKIPLAYKAAGAIVLGPTATPIRVDQRGLGEVYDALVIPITPRQAVEQGYLVPYDLIRPERALRGDQVAADPVESYCTHAAGRKAVVFAANLKAAAEYADRFNARGIPAAMISGETETKERRSALERYARGELTVLTGQSVLTEGWDDPPTSCVILARKVGSLSLYLQALGRGLRTSPGKENCIILDLTGSSYEHGEPTDDREWCLDGEAIKKKLKAPTERFCLVCKVLIDGDSGTTVCELCGIARPEAQIPEVMNLKLVRYAAKLKESPEKRRAYFDKLRAVAESKGHSKWAAAAKYKAIYGEYPPREWTKVSYDSKIMGPRE